MSTALVIANARLWPPAGEADALRVAHGRIERLGRSADLDADAAGARRIDARGALVTPGLCDAHIHFVPWAQGRRQVDLLGVRSRSEAQARVAAALAGEPGDRPLVGRGWDEATWDGPPTRADLDALSPARPVLLHRHDFHALWVNSAALRATGITAATPDPEGGRFVRDAAGEPTGLVQEHAVRRFEPLLEAAGPELDDALLDDAAAALHAAGVTAVHDFQRNAADFRRMRALAGRRRLRVLQHVGPEQLDALAGAGAGSGLGDAWFRIGALKLFADGTLGSRTASMLEPFADRGGLGMELLSRTELLAAVADATRRGFACAIHAIGDRAVRHALDAFESAPPSRRNLALPSRIEHVQLAAERDLARFAPLGVAASMQPQHAVSDAEMALAAWGSGRCRNAYPLRTLLAAGVTLAFGSDAPVEPPLAALGLHAALTRTRADGSPAGGFVPAQSIGLADALRAYTEGAARLAGYSGGPVGLAPGAAADLVVWDRDLFGPGEGSEARGLATARAAVTVLGGEIVYESGERGAAAGFATAGRGRGTAE